MTMETIIYNGKVYVDKDHFEEALYIKDGLIVAVGSNQEIMELAGEGCEKLDAGGKTILPGFIDSHLHLLSVGEYLVLPRLRDARTIDELVEIGRKFIEDKPKLVEGGLIAGGWNQDLFTGEKRMPSRHDLDRISREIPIIFERVCGHVATANTKALELAGLFDEIPKLEGGTIELEEDGTPSGILNEGEAFSYVARHFPRPSLEELESYYISAIDHAVSFGLTSVHSTDARDNNYKEIFELLKKLKREGKLLLRFRHQINLEEPDNLRDFLASEYQDESYDEQLYLGPLKLFKDGSLGGRTALLSKEYQDEPGNFGIEVISNERMDELVGLAHEGAMQVVTHVIGDEAASRVLDSYEKVIKGGNKLRHGLVHTQITDLKLLERIRDLEVACLVQPIFLDYDLHIVDDRVGPELASTSYAFKTMNKLGINTSYGTDSPIEELNPFPGIYCAVTRKDLEGYPERGHYPDERVSLEEAIDSYTLGGAHIEFNEDRKGRLKPGYLADLVIIDRDIFTIPEEEIKDLKVELTMVGGRVVYKKDDKK